MLVIPFLAALIVCVSAAQQPFLQDNNDTTNLDIGHTRPVWNCSLRAWVRAADLSPSSVVPAEMRLAANGTECGDIVGMKVGLRLKERAIVKLKYRSSPTQRESGV